MALHFAAFIQIFAHRSFPVFLSSMLWPDSGADSTTHRLKTGNTVGLTSMNVVVKCTVRGTHQMNQTGLAEPNSVLFYNANTHTQKKKKICEKLYLYN